MSSITGGYRNDLHRVMEKVCSDFHAALLAQANPTTARAYQYCADVPIVGARGVQPRGIHPQVIADSLLGVVPPGYDEATVFQPIIETVEEEAKKMAADGSGKPRGMTPEERVNALKETCEKLAKCAQPGWLALFYTDAHHRFVAIRFRQPYSKEILYFKPLKTAGLFGRELFSPYTSDGTKDFNDFLLVTEGEFNQLQLQSLMIRYGEATGEQQGYVNACSVGGVNNADYETIRAVARRRIFCYDNDADGAGFELVRSAQEVMSVAAFTTPEPDTDLDDFICSFGDDHTAAFGAVRELVRNRKPYPRFFEGVAAEIYEIRRNHKGDARREFEIHTAVADVLYEDLLDRGRFYTDGQFAFFFSEEEKKLTGIDKDSSEFRCSLFNYGLNPSERVYKYVYEDLLARALRDGVRSEVHRLCYYNAETFTLYLSNHANLIYRISPESIDLIDNGTDGVLFLSDKRYKPFIVGEPDLSRSYFDEIIVSKIKLADDRLNAGERKLVFTIWFNSIFFDSIMPTKIILAFFGPWGSGKTNTARKLLKLLFGPSVDVMLLSEDVKDFDAAVTSNYLLVVDNADSKSAWLNDRLAVVATGGTIKKRELYTTNKFVEFPTRCFLILTARTPHFRREDVASRLLLMRVARIESFVSETKLLQEVLDNRDNIMTEVVYHLQEIVRALRDEHGNDYSSTFRMGDFADFAIKVARQMGVENELLCIFEKLSQEQSEFTLEDDSIFELLKLWVPDDGKTSREVTNTLLCMELAVLADKNGLEFSYEGRTRSFAQRISNILPSLQEFFTITERRGKSNRLFRSFTRKDEKKK